MTKTARNSPCPCGSGKKYKRCCLDKVKKTVIPNITPLSCPDGKDRILQGQEDWNYDQNLCEWSNNSMDLIREGKLEEAEILAKKLLETFPELHDGWERMAMIYEEKKQYQKAEEYYIKADHIIISSDGYEDELADFLKVKAIEMRSRINQK